MTTSSSISGGAVKKLGLSGVAGSLSMMFGNVGSLKEQLYVGIGGLAVYGIDHLGTVLKAMHIPVNAKELGPVERAMVNQVDKMLSGKLPKSFTTTTTVSKLAQSLTQVQTTTPEGTTK